MSISIVYRSIWSNPGNYGRRIEKAGAAVVWQIRKRLVRKPKVLTLANGVRFHAHPDCVVSSALHYAEWPEYRELQFLRSKLRRGQLLFDVGANVGHISLLLADIVGAENIFAFEPTPLTFSRLVANFELNNWPTTGLLHAAVGRENGEIEISDLEAPVTTNSIKFGNPTERKAMVKLMSLDSMVGICRGREVGFLKVDVEGFEPEVFSGARTFLQEIRPRFILFESLEGCPNGLVKNLLEQAGYVLFQLDNKGQPNFALLSAQNLFAAPKEFQMLKA